MNRKRRIINYQLSGPTSEIAQRSQIEFSTQEEKNTRTSFIQPQIYFDSNNSNYDNSNSSRTDQNIHRYNSVVKHDVPQQRPSKFLSKDRSSSINRHLNPGVSESDAVGINEFQNRKLQRVQAILADLRRK